jgi:hypothetical protein
VVLDATVEPWNDKGLLITTSESIPRGVVALVGDPELLPEGCTALVLSGLISDAEVKLGGFER